VTHHSHKAACEGVETHHHHLTCLKTLHTSLLFQSSTRPNPPAPSHQTHASHLPSNDRSAPTPQQQSRTQLNHRPDPQITPRIHIHIHIPERTRVQRVTSPSAPHPRTHSGTEDEACLVSDPRLRLQRAGLGYLVLGVLVGICIRIPRDALCCVALRRSLYGALGQWPRREGRWMALIRRVVRRGETLWGGVLWAREDGW
jgi:hypothetical protein